MDYAGLKAEIALPKYAGMTDAQIEAALTVSVVANVAVPVAAVMSYLALQGKFAVLQAYAASAGMTQAGIAAKELVVLLTTPGITAFDLSVPATLAAVTAFLDALAADAASGITTADATALLALGQQSTTHAQQLGFSDVHDLTQEIAAARVWPGVSV